MKSASEIRRQIIRADSCFDFNKSLSLSKHLLEKNVEHSFLLNQFIKLSIILKNKNLVDIFFKNFRNYKKKIKIDNHLYNHHTDLFPSYLDKYYEFFDIINKEFKFSEDYYLEAYPNVIKIAFTLELYAVYEMNCICNFCKNEHHLKITGTIGIIKKYACPFCFKKYFVDFEFLCDKLKKYEHLLSKKDFVFNNLLVNYSNDFKLFKKSQKNILFDYLGQDLYTYFHEVIIKRILEKNVK